jgi:hypothetical protein
MNSTNEEAPLQGLPDDLPGTDCYATEFVSFNCIKSTNRVYSAGPYSGLTGI